jgi:hypothetical protein
MFIKKFTGSQAILVDDLIKKVNKVADDHFRDTGMSLDEDLEAMTLADLRNTNYFSAVHQAVRS